MARSIGVACVVLLCLSFVGCAGVQQSVVTSRSNYEIVSRACVDALSDIRYVLSAHDLASGLIVARPGFEGNESYSKMNIVLAKTPDGVSVSVKYIPTSGTTGDRGVVDAFVKALRKRLPDSAVSRTRLPVH